MALTNFGNFKVLGQFFMPATESMMYAAPTNKQVEISSIWVHNTGTSTQTYKIFAPALATQTGSFVKERISESITGASCVEIAPKIPFILNGTNSETINFLATVSGSISVLLTGREEV